MLHKKYVLIPFC